MCVNLIACFEIIKLCQKQLRRNLASVNIKLKEIKFFTQSPTKIFCISIFNVEGCLASCLTYRPFKKTCELFDLKRLFNILCSRTFMKEHPRT